MSDETVTPSSGCVFRDLELPNPSLLAAKGDLLIGIHGQIEHGAARLEDLGLSEEMSAALMAGRLGSFTLDDLWRIAEKTGLIVDVVIN